MFEDKLHHRYKNFVASQRLPTLRAVVDSRGVVERNRLEEQKIHETPTKLKVDENLRVRIPSNRRSKARLKVKVTRGRILVRSESH